MTVHIGAYTLTVPQSLAWHSTDEGEREQVRAEVRAACRRSLAGRIEESMVVRGVGGQLLERVERE